ncbi:MAG: hypothetical protein AABY16_00345 [Nanoarchaeota archaeon]
MRSSAEIFKNEGDAGVDMVYTGRELITAVNDRGWNLYDSTDTQGDPANADGIIIMGPAEKLEVGRRYVLLPDCAQPTNPQKVFGALKSVADALDGKMPTIQIGGRRHDVTGFRIIGAGEIKVNTPDGEQFFPYDAAIVAARTLFNTGTMEHD